jgi:hypothetical protein
MIPKEKPSLPPDKRPFYSSHNNWVFFKIRQTSQAAEVVFNSAIGWTASIVSSAVCIGIGMAVFLATKNSLCWLIIGPTVLALVGINWHICEREANRGPLLRFPKGSGTVELARHGKSYLLNNSTLKLRLYNLTGDFTSELILETNEGERYPLTKWLGSDPRLVKLFNSLAGYGLRFEEEDLRGFKWP